MRSKFVNMSMNNSSMIFQNYNNLVSCRNKRSTAVKMGNFRSTPRDISRALKFSTKRVEGKKLSRLLRKMDAARRDRFDRSAREREEMTDTCQYGIEEWL